MRCLIESCVCVVHQSLDELCIKCNPCMIETLSLSGLAFNVYRLIPLLPELREVMDWVFTDTVLSLINWFKVQEIYAQLYLVKVQRNREKVIIHATTTLIERR